MSRRTTLLVGLLLGALVGVAGFCWWVVRDRTLTDTGGGPTDRADEPGVALEAVSR